VAEVVKAVGLQGSVKLYPLLDWYEPMLDAAVLVWEDGSHVGIESWRPQGTCYVVSVRGCGTRDAAEQQVGRMVGFLRSRYHDPGFPRPAVGLPFRWLGREVRLVSGETVGSVEEVRRHGAQFTLVVPSNEKEILIPALPPILVREEDPDGPLVIDPPEGLLDVAGD
jgi:16S rRNA processing protein RimM